MTAPSSTPEHRGRGEHGEPPPAAPCVGCAHLYTTWDAARPRGCRAYGFQSARWPSQVVQHSSGHECRLREPRPRPEPRRPRQEPDDDALYG